MNLDDAQKKQIAAWVAEGLKLSEVQKRMETELGLRMTYMELRLLIDDLKVMPKDPEPTSATDAALGPAQARAPGQTVNRPPDRPESEGADLDSIPAGEGVSVQVDAVTRAGALVSGSVRFSDGQTAKWYLDQTGRLGLAPLQQGYRPSAADLQTFQTELQSELQRMGF